MGIRTVYGWNEATIWKGSNSQLCAICWEPILRHTWSKVHKLTGRAYHDDCAEDNGAYVGT